MRKNYPGIPTRAVLACLFAALCCAGAYISIPIPISPVPLALTNLFAVLGGLLLGPLWGALSALAYVMIGSLGFPVFSGGHGGLAYLAGPTGGYLIGYIIAAFLAGLVGRKGLGVFLILGAALGFASILIVGALGLTLINGIDLGRSLAIGVLPFIPLDTLKAILAVIIARNLRRFVQSLTARDDARD